MPRSKIVFMGTPSFVVPVLEALVTRHDVVAVFTRAPKPAGRGKTLTPSPVEEAARRLNIPVYTPASFRKDPEAVKELQTVKADIAVVAAYGLILTEDVLKAFPKGIINIHPSLLPRWRGCTPVESALLAGDKETGVAIQQVALEVDAGDLLLVEKLPILQTDTAESLRAKLFKIGADLVLRVLDGEGKPVKQPEEGVTFSGKIKKEDGLLDFKNSTAEELNRKIRALLCFFIRNGEKINVLSSQVFETKQAGVPGTVLSNKKEFIIQTKSFPLRLTKLQRPGKTVIDDTAFLNGYKIETGDAL